MDAFNLSHFSACMYPCIIAKQGLYNVVSLDSIHIIWGIWGSPQTFALTPTLPYVTSKFTF